MLIPLAIPTLIATQFWDVMFTEDATGVINSILISLGVMKQPNAWLLDPDLQIPALILVIVWKETPGMALLLLPGLLSISKETYEAAEVDGLNRFQRFLYITLPLMRPTIGVALVLRTMVTLRVFDVFDILLGRLRFSMSTYAFETLTLRQQLGYSSAISVTIFLIILVFTVIYVRTLRIDEV
jgi:trehalose/maltose transport system permease protein